jgi:hypothetical protein
MTPEETGLRLISDQYVFIRQLADNRKSLTLAQFFSQA